MYAVLYVDDEPELHNLAQMYLEETGIFTLDTAASAKEAQQKLARNRYDAVVADYQMPAMDGIQFLKYVRENYENLPFILFTGKGREEVVIEAINNGADYYLQKGGDPDPLFAELIHKLRQAIQLREEQATIRINAERLHRAQEIGHTGAWEYIIKNETIWGSAESFRIFGIDSPDGEIPVARIEACIRQKEFSRSALRDLIRSGKEYNIVYDIDPADGGPAKVVRSVAELEKDRDGNPVKVLGVIQDVTGQTRTEDALRESELKFRSLVEHSLQGVAISKGRRVLYANRSLLAMYGYDTFEEFQKIPVIDHLTPECREEAVGLMKKYGRGEKIDDLIIQNIRRKDGEIRTLAFHIAPIEYQGETCEQLTFLDITEHRQAQTALTASERRFRDIYENAPVGIFRATATGKLIHANPALAHMLGYDDVAAMIDTINHATFMEAVHGDATQMEESAPDSMNPRGWARTEKEFVKAEGSRVIFSIIYRPVKNNKTGEVELQGFCADITEYRKVVDALVESEKRFQDVTNNAGEWIWEVDTEGLYRYSSMGGEKMHGYGPDELVGKMHFYDLFIGDEREKLKQAAFKVFREKGSFRGFVNANLHKDGSIVILETSGTPILGPDGTLIGYRGTDLDVTEKKRAQDELQKNEERFRQLVDQLQDSVVIIAEDGTILFCNPAAYRLGGTSPDEDIIGQNIRRFLEPITIPQVMTDLNAAFSGCPVRISEYEVLAPDKTRHWLEASGTQIQYQGRPSVMVAIRDVTDRKRARDELVMINRKLELLSSITRHDIINKITVILGKLRMAKKKNTEPEIAEILERLEIAAKSIRSQIEFTRIYHILGSHEPQWQKVALILPYKSIPPEVEFVNHIGDDLEIFADPMLEKVFYNLLDNAIKHGDHVSGISLSSARSGDRLTITWEDNGKGIPDEEKEQIFERGFGENSGLGLFLSREILAITEITIHETGKAGSGARFELDIPAGHFRFDGSEWEKGP